MRHKWKQKRFRRKLYTRHTVNLPVRDSFNVKVGKTFECVNCGLRKGTTRDLGFFPCVVYMDDRNNILSVHTIPFKCSGIKIEKDFFDEVEFTL